MIFKKLKNIYLNENFDFGDLDIQSTAADDLRMTPEMIRTIANKNLMPCDVLTAKYNWTPAPILKRRKLWGDHTGNVQSKEYNENFTSNCYKVNNPASFNNLSRLGFTYVRLYNSGKEKEIPDFLVGFCNDFISNTSLTADTPNCMFDYWLSPDGGIAIIKYIAIYDNDDHQRNNNNCYFMFTGDVIYEVNDVSSENLKSGKNKSFDNSRPFKFLEALGCRMKLTIDQISAFGVTDYNGRLVFYLNNASKDLDGFKSNELLTPKQYNDHSMAYLWRMHVLRKLFKWPETKRMGYVHDIKFDYRLDKEMGFYVNYELTDLNDYIIIHETNDVNILSEYVGRENVSKCKKWSDMTPCMNIEENRGFPAYTFIVLTDKGMALYNDFASGNITLEKLKKPAK